MSIINKKNLTGGCLIISAIGVLLLCLSPFIVFGSIPLYHEFRLRRTFQAFDGAEKIAEDLGGGYWGNSLNKSLYYWTEEPVEVVQNYYENFTTPFVSAEYWEGKWLIAFLNGNVDIESSPAHGVSPAYDLPSYPSCSYRHTYVCVTVVLVDAHQDDFYRIGGMSPSVFRRIEPLPEFSIIPDYGTIIVYSYFVVRW
jgi:hypothetical protein